MVFSPFTRPTLSLSLTFFLPSLAHFHVPQWAPNKWGAKK